jgi:hypothetical protein
MHRFNLDLFSSLTCFTTLVAAIASVLLSKSQTDTTLQALQTDKQIHQNQEREAHHS